MKTPKPIKLGLFKNPGLTPKQNKSIGILKNHFFFKFLVYRTDIDDQSIM